MRSDDISQDIRTKTPSGDRDIGERTGKILAWDDLTGANTVDIEGQVFQDLDVMINGIGVRYSVNDVVSVKRKQSRYYVDGKIGAVNGSAGSSIQEGVFGFQDTVTPTAGVWIDVPSGVASVQAYIGSSKMALVIWRADITANNSFGEVGWAVSGASTVAPGTVAGTSVKHDASTAGTPSTAVKTTTNGFYTCRPIFGLNRGLNVFTIKYRAGVSGTGVSTVFGSPQITVIPL